MTKPKVMKQTVLKQTTQEVEEALLQYIDSDMVMKPRKAAIVNKELDHIEMKFGVITPEKVLESASPYDSPIHDDFEWDDARAGHRHRLNQARALIIGARIVLRRQRTKLTNGVQIRVRKYLSRGNGQGFTKRAVALGEVEMRQHLVRTKLRAIRSAVHELVDIAELDAFRKEMGKQVEAAGAVMEIEL